jgi:hypothetical protein
MFSGGFGVLRAAASPCLESIAKHGENAFLELARCISGKRTRRQSAEKDSEQLELLQFSEEKPAHGFGQTAR